MKNAFISLVLSAIVFAPSLAAAKIVIPAVSQVSAVKPAKPVVVVKKAVIIKKTAAVPVKPVAKVAPKPVVKVAVVSVEPEEDSLDEEGDISEANDEEVVAKVAAPKPNAACMSAILRANTFCSKIAKGCSSQNKTEKCLAANEECEAHQEVALDLCPKAN